MLFRSTAQSTSFTAVKLAQNAGTLVGGPLLAGPGANQNSTVSAVLQGLGIDPRSGLNVLDLINLSLNFLEVAVMNLFARKDNVDLTHVGKITKAMADLQSTMQDMIDDGVDVGSGQRPQAINNPQQAINQNIATPNVAPTNYSQDGVVGRTMGMSNALPMNPVGGGVALASSNNNFVWASKDGKREVFASTNNNKSVPSNKVTRLTENLLSLKNALNDSEIQKRIDTVIRVSNERNKNIKTNAPILAEGRNQMDHFAKIASEQRKKLAAAVTIDFKVEDAAGNRVVLSTDGSITGFTNGRRTNWEPILTENQINLMENGQGTRVAAELLNEYGKFVKTALLDVKERLDDREEQLEEVRTGPSYDQQSVGVKSKNTGVHDMTKEELLESKRTGAGQNAIENALGDVALYGRKVKDEEVKKSLQQLVAEVNKGVPTEVIEKRLQECRADGKASAHEIMSATINALGKAVVSSFETPNTIMRVAQVLSQEEALPEMVGTAAAGAPMDAANAEKAEFFGTDQEPMDSVTAVLKQLGAAVSADQCCQCRLSQSFQP